MKKIKIISILLVFVLLLGGCGSNNEQSNSDADKETPPVETQSVNDEKDLSQTADNSLLEDEEQESTADSDKKNEEELQSATSKGDADTPILSSNAVAEQSSKPSDKTLNQNTATENKVLYLPDVAASWAYYVLNQGATYSAALIEAKAEGTDAGDVINRLDSSVISLLEKHIFNDEVPDFWPLNSNLHASQEFTDWLIERAKKAGIFDKRLNLIISPKVILTVNAKDYESGTSYNVFGESYTVGVDGVEKQQ